MGRNEQINKWIINGERKQIYVTENTEILSNLCKISGSHGGEYQDGCLLGCWAMQSGRNWPKFQTCLLQWSRQLNYCSTEKSVNFYQTTRRNIPEDSPLHVELMVSCSILSLANYYSPKRMWLLQKRMPFGKPNRHDWFIGNLMPPREVLKFKNRNEVCGRLLTIRTEENRSYSI
jgi:hypothetical protein